MIAFLKDLPWAPFLLGCVITASVILYVFALDNLKVDIMSEELKEKLKGSAGSKSKSWITTDCSEVTTTTVQFSGEDRPVFCERHQDAVDADMLIDPLKMPYPK